MSDIIATDADKKEKLIRYSEIFGNTIQGEGKYTGVPTVWLRLWGCNLTCSAFGQENVADPSTWVLPSEDFDVSTVTRLEDLPVWHTGCDSSYSYAKKFMKLSKRNTANEIAEKLIDLLKHPYNSNGLFEHPHSMQETHMAFTGGEPMMNQPAIINIMEAMHARDKNSPVKVTVETNGTQPIKEEFADFLNKRFHLREQVGGMITKDRRAHSEWFWSVSPKLRNSGEKWDDAIKPEVVAAYNDLSPYGQLKFVVDNDKDTWFEVDQAIKLYREQGIDWPIYIMPVGADEEMQKANAADVAREAIARGYNVAVRAHIALFGNAIGT